MKKLKKDLEAVLKNLNGLAQKVQKLQEKIDKDTKPTRKPKTKAVEKVPGKTVAVKKAKPVTAVDTVFNIIKRYKKGVGTVALMKKTGYNQKKIANLVFKLRKQGKIKSVAKGVYVKV